MIRDKILALVFGLIAAVLVAAGTAKIYAAEAPAVAATSDHGVAEVLVILERPPRNGTPFPIHYYVFIARDGQFAILSPGDLSVSRAMLDLYNSQRLLGHVITVVISPVDHADVVCT